ncbi:MAG: acyl-CoA thioesterase [Paludibacteraceae bacterium]
MMYIYELDLKVRDYECDLQGIVNNSNYQRYYEHTRHEFLLEQGVSFSDLHDEGIDTMVARIEIAYKTPLKPRDEFTSKLYVSKEGIKYMFHQALYRKRDNKLCSTAKVTTVITINGVLTADFEPFDKLCGQSKR